jgi:hypothetical protein
LPESRGEGDIHQIFKNICCNVYFESASLEEIDRGKDACSYTKILNARD